MVDNNDFLDLGEFEDPSIIWEEDNTEKEEKNNSEVAEEENEESQPESVGNEEEDKNNEDENNQESEDTPSDEEDNEGSPTSSIALLKSLKEVGVLSHLEDKDIESVESIEDLRDAFEQEFYNRLDDWNKRTYQAFSANMDISTVQKYENIIAQLNSVSNEELENESDAASNVRKQIIIMDFMNNGISQEKAEKLAEKAIKLGTDIEDAKEALESCKTYWNNAYNKEIADTTEKQQKQKKELKQNLEKLEKSIMEDDKIFKELDLPKSVRKQIYSNAVVPTEVDDNGQRMSAIRKYAQENPLEYYKYMGLFYTLTDGFKNVGSLLDGPIKKGVRKKLSNLEDAVRNTQITGGNLKLNTGVKDTKPSLSDFDDWSIRDN